MYAQWDGGGGGETNHLPTSLFLVGAGALGIVGALRCRVNHFTRSPAPSRPSPPTSAGLRRPAARSAAGDAGKCGEPGGSPRFLCCLTALTCIRRFRLGFLLGLRFGGGLLLYLESYRVGVHLRTSLPQTIELSTRIVESSLRFIMKNLSPSEHRVGKMHSMPLL